jgi:hypothetical protein
MEKQPVRPPARRRTRLTCELQRQRDWRDCFQAAGISAGMSRRRTRRARRGRTSARYSTGLTSARAQLPRTV